MGGINIKFILIGAVLVILLVVFGGNKHVDPAQRKRDAAIAAGKDPLVEAIEEHNNPSGHGLGALSSMLGRGSSSGLLGAQGSSASGYNQQRPMGYNPNNANQQAYPQQTGAPPVDSYYPPPPLPANNTMR